MMHRKWWTGSWRAGAAGRSIVIMCLAALASAGCGGQPTVGAETPAALDDGWVELDEGSILAEDFGLGDAAAEPATMSLEQARSQLPFDFSLPAWAPDGYLLQPEVEVVQSAEASSSGYASLTVGWVQAEAAVIYLQISQAANGPPRLGGAGQAEAVRVNGQPASLVRGGALGPERLTLAWTQGGLAYSLSADGGGVPAEALVRMAESIP